MKVKFILNFKSFKMIDKSKELTASVQLINDRLHFLGKADGNETVSIDYIPPFGDNLGYTSLELLLLSLTSCIGSAVLLFLRRMNKTISGCEIKAVGQRREEHPTGFRNIDVTILIESSDISDDDMIKVIKLAEDKYWPVYSMIRGNTDVQISCIVNK